ncbi:hypothetical protein Tco_1064387 [Tanacetum coccineum]
MFFHAFYKVSKQGHWFSFKKRVGKGAGGQVFRETFSGLKGWKKRFFFLDRRAIPDAMAWRHHDLYVNDPASEDGFSMSDVQTLTERVIDLRPVPSRLLFQGGLATTWDFPSFHPIFKDTEGNAAAKKRENKKRGSDEGEGSRPKVKMRKASAARKDGSATSEHISSLKPIRTVDPTGLANGNCSGAAAKTAESRENRSLHVPPHDSTSRSIHNYTDARDDEETNSLRLGSFLDQSGRNLTFVQTEVFQSSPGNHSVHPSPTIERTTSPTRSRLQGAPSLLLIESIVYI